MKRLLIFLFFISFYGNSQEFHSYVDNAIEAEKLCGDVANSSTTNKSVNDAFDKAAYDAYEKYNKLYDRDIDALLEFGEICTHIDSWDEAIKHFTDSSKYQAKNPFHLVRIGEVYARKRSYNKMQEKFWEFHL